MLNQIKTSNRERMAETSKLQQKSGIYGPLNYVFHRHYKDASVYTNRLLRERLGVAKDLFRKDLKGHFGCVNAIEFSPGGGELIASGGDDRRVLLWKTETAVSGLNSPRILKGEHHSNIFCLAFDNTCKRVFSGVPLIPVNMTTDVDEQTIMKTMAPIKGYMGNDEQVIVHDIESGETQDVFNHEDAVYGLSMDPVNESIFASACDDGRVLIFDTRAPPGEEPFVLANYPSPMHAVMYNPVEPRLLATANAKEGIGLWDVRKPRSAVLRYGGSLSQQSCMSVRVSQCGTRLLALRRRLPPVLYEIHSSVPLFQFDHAGYYNSCTMKSCCFAGDHDQYVVSGSDDFNLYMWKIPDTPLEVPWVSEAHLVLKGHRSIVNQVRFNPANHLLLSSGVEKVIKMWSPFHMSDSEGNLGDEPIQVDERPVYTHEEYINLVLRNGQVMSHDYTHQSTDEDPRMMAFFDSLVQRELEGWSSDESVGVMSDPFVQPSHSDSADSDGNSNSDDEDGLRLFTLAFERAVANSRNHLEGDNNNQPSLLEFDPLNNRQDTEPSLGSSSLPGQQGSHTRRSITELITQKRKEYLANVCRAERGQTKKKRTFARRVLEEGFSSDSSDDNVPVVRRKKQSKQPGTSSEVNSSPSEGERRDTSEQQCTSQQEKNLALQRLKRMRTRVLNSESDEDVKDKSINKIPTSEKGESGENIFEHVEQVLTIVNHGASTSQQCQKTDNTTNNQIGPHLSEAVFEDDKPIVAKPNTTNGVASSFANANGDICNPSSTTVNNTDCNSNCNGSTTTANGADDQCSNNSIPSTSDGASNNHNNNSGPEQPTWEEFKRFKNRLERARRHYRRRNSQHDGQSSGNDT